MRPSDNQDEKTGVATAGTMHKRTWVGKHGKRIISLPLMGIGNPGRHHHHQRRAGVTLITPHGDRKLRRTRHPPATTPSHYPSWGSETVWHEGKKRVEPGAHYPSWGSETGRLHVHVHRAVAASLPLMGIGNLRHLSLAPPAAHLITPHGDRKPLTGRGELIDRDRTHYPSWGSETPVRPVRRIVRADTHYPSWGSETWTNRGPTKRAR